MPPHRLLFYALPLLYPEPVSPPWSRSLEVPVDIKPDVKKPTARTKLRPIAPMSTPSVEPKLEASVKGQFNDEVGVRVKVESPVVDVGIKAEPVPSSRCADLHLSQV